MTQHQAQEMLSTLQAILASLNAITAHNESIHRESI